MYAERRKCWEFVFPGASLVVQLVKNLSAVQEILVQFLGREIPWRRDRLLTPVFLPGEFPRTQEAGRLQPMGVVKVGHG